jgi:hypothetical protein
LKTQGASANPLWDDAPASAPHADTHQDGGDDEVATTTPSSGAIPKAGTDSKLPAGFIDTLTAEGPSQTLVDSAEEDRWTKVERAAGETTHTAQVTNSVGAPTEKPDPPVLDTEYTVDGAGQPLATNIHLDAVMTEGSGATLDDISGNGRDGTIVGPVWDTDANPLYTPFLDADGINDYVTFGDCGGFGRTQAWTTHFKIKTAPGYSFGGVIVGRCNASYYVGWYQGLDNNGKVYMVMQNGGNYIQVHGSTSVNDGNWHDVTVRHSGSGVASGISMWVDGVAESMTIDSDTLGSNSINNSDALRMFAMVNGQYGDYIATHLAIWQRALEAVEAVDLHDMPYVMEGGVIGQVTSDIAYVTVAPATEDGDTADVTVGQTASRVSVPGKLVVVNGRLRCAADTKYGPPVSGTYAVGDLFFDRAGSLWQCSVAGAPGTWVQVEPGRQTTAQWTDFATGGNWNGGAALADYRCYEPDFDETWTYDATHGWLGRYWEAISEHTSDVTGSSQYRLGILPRVHNLLMTHAMAYTGVSSCDANNYWTVRLCKAYLSGGSFSYTACTDDVVRDSTGNLETTWTPDGVVIDTDVYGWYARQYAKTGSPGTLTFGHVGVTFRYVRK